MITTRRVARWVILPPSRCPFMPFSCLASAIHKHTAHRVTHIRAVRVLWVGGDLRYMVCVWWVVIQSAVGAMLFKTNRQPLNTKERRDGNIDPRSQLTIISLPASSSLLCAFHSCSHALTHSCTNAHGLLLNSSRKRGHSSKKKQQSDRGLRPGCTNFTSHTTRSSQRATARSQQ